MEISGEGLKTVGQFTVDGEIIEPADHEKLQLMLKAGALRGNADLQTDDSGNTEAMGDPMEVAFLVALVKAGFSKDTLLTEYPEEYEVAFDPEKKMMATVHKKNEGYFLQSKELLKRSLRCAQEYIGNKGAEVFNEELRNKWLSNQKGWPVKACVFWLWL